MTVEQISTRFRLPFLEPIQDELVDRLSGGLTHDDDEHSRNERDAVRGRSEKTRLQRVN